MGCMTYFNMFYICLYDRFEVFRDEWLTMDCTYPKVWVWASQLYNMYFYLLCLNVIWL
jgi:hypothetical protein